jgi:DNA polymerase
MCKMKSDAEKTLLSLKSEAEKCKRCGLYKTRTNVVFGIGPATAKVMLVGEAAGFFEDKQGVPFVGAAGKNLNALLREAGLKREDVYIGNVLKCRPPRNRPPLPDEIEACRPFLEGQISTVEPELVITLGRTAARALLSKNVVMGREHGTLLDCTYAGVKFKLFLTYHPAAALYGAEAKQKLQTDFKKLGQLISKMT